MSLTFGNLWPEKEVLAKKVASVIVHLRGFRGKSFAPIPLAFAVGSVMLFSTVCPAQELSVSAFLPALSCVLAPCDPADTLDALAPIELLKTQPAKIPPTTDGLMAEKRLFGVIPNYRAEQTQPVYIPLTSRQKFAIAKSDSFDWPNYLLLVGYAAQSQVASGGFNHNGGTSGFAKFYARSVGDQIIGSYVTEAILPSLLHEDPRFFRLGTGSFFHRASHAAVSILITKSDSGHARFNVAEVAGNAGVVALTTVYYPNSRTPSEGFERFSMALGNDVVSNLLTEFWPDIKRRLTQQKGFFAKRRSPEDH